MKKNILTLLASFLIIGSSFAQIGINGGYNLNDAANWKIVDKNNSNNVIHDFFENSISFGLDYWFRLPNYRIEFTPELNYQNTKSTYQYDPLSFEANSTILSFFVNTNIYLFDLEGDCDCPTFSKKGPELQKGFFFRISPGISYFDTQLNYEGIELKSNNFAFSIGAGIGLDLGITDVLTITPIAVYRYYPSVEWAQFSMVDAGIKEWDYPEDESIITQIYLGLRVGLRFDYQ
jgi:hypothetical protein